MNKLDVFEAKMAYSPVVDYFPDYKLKLGAQTVKTARVFFMKKFLLNSDGEETKGDRRFYSHFTTNTDKKLTAFIIKAVVNTIVQVILSTLSMN